MIDHGVHNILGVRIAAVDYAAVVEKVLAAAKRRRPMAVSALAVHGVMTDVLDAEQRYRLNRFDLLLPDGQPVRWALRWLHDVRLPDRVYGPTLMERLCEQAAIEELPVFFYGSTEAVVTQLRRNLQRRIPQLNVAGVQPSLFRRLTAREQAQRLADIQASGARLTFVGIGCPRQEVWTYECHQALNMPVVAVGGAFPLHAGLRHQAPPSLQRGGLEWLYRLWQEPGRLWKRYVLLNPLYVANLALQWSHLRTLSPTDAHPPLREERYG